MPSLTETLGAEPAQQGNIAQGLNQGLQTGMQLATMQDQVESQKLKVQQQKEEIDNSKYNKVTSMLDKISKASPQARRRIVTAYKGQLQQLGIPMSEATMQELSQDENLGNHISELSRSGFLDELGKTPETREAVFSGLSDQLGIADAVKEVMAMKKQSSAERVAQMHNDTLIKAAQVRGDSNVEAAQIRGGVGQERLHNSNVDKITKDPALAKIQVQYNNLNNAISNIESGAAPTPESFAELQQAVRNNLGIKGSGGVSERSGTYLKGLGLNAADITQFFSMNPQDITSYGGTPFLEHIKSLARNEQSNIQKFAEKKIDTAEKSHSAYYKSHPQNADDWMATVDGVRNQFGLPPKNKTSAAPTDSASSAQPPATDQSAAPKKFDAAAFVQKARASNRTDAQIQQYLQSKGLKPELIQQALSQTVGGL